MLSVQRRDLLSVRFADQARYAVRIIYTEQEERSNRRKARGTILIDIYERVKEERARQDIIHDWSTKTVFPCRSETVAWYEDRSDVVKNQNDEADGRGVIFADRVILEEYYETFAEKDINKQLAELIQLIAVSVRYAEHLVSKGAKID